MIDPLFYMVTISIEDFRYRDLGVTRVKETALQTKQRGHSDLLRVRMSAASAQIMFKLFSLVLVVLTTCLLSSCSRNPGTNASRTNQASSSNSTTVSGNTSS